ncbi:MAG: MgtC/SapB family protein [Agathobacter sp.]|nr:MgtC/SapB family protein [Agathobacter sp.]
MDWELAQIVIFRLVLAVVIGGLFGNERAKQGRAAGLRTHILVCMGAALTAMVGIYLHEYLGITDDVQRISAQVISGIGFLGAGMIIVKNNNVISGLTTAAGVWCTSIIGIAIGFGFYYGAIPAAVIFMIVLHLLTKLERNKHTRRVYLEVDDMYKTNEVLDAIHSCLDADITSSIVAARSQNVSHIGINLVIEKKKKKKVDLGCLKCIDHVVFLDVE